MENTKVRSLWNFRLRKLGIDNSQRAIFSLHSACRQHCTEQEAVNQIRQRFTPQWWEGYLMIEVTEVGELHMIDGEALYE